MDPGGRRGGPGDVSDLVSQWILFYMRMQHDFVEATSKGRPNVICLRAKIPMQRPTLSCFHRSQVQVCWY